MKYENGVSYYIICSNYDGKNKDILSDTFNLETLFVNNINIQYDWRSKNYYAQDSV